jgi:hypothetical protein
MLGMSERSLSRPSASPNRRQILRLDQSLAIAEHHLTAKVVGDKGALVATWDGELDRTTQPRASLELFDGNRLSEVPMEAFGEFFELRSEMRHFVDVCRGEATQIITPDEAARAVAICWAAECSVRSGKAERCLRV